MVLVGLLYLIASTVGFRLALYRDSQPIDLLLKLVLAAVVTLLCVVDSRSQGKTIGFSVQWLILLTWPVSAPLCLVWSRGAKGFLLFLIHGILLFVTAVVSYSIAEYFKNPRW